MLNYLPICLFVTCTFIANLLSTPSIFWEQDMNCALCTRHTGFDLTAKCQTHLSEISNIFNFYAYPPNWQLDEWQRSDVSITSSMAICCGLLAERQINTCADPNQPQGIIKESEKRWASVRKFLGHVVEIKHICKVMEGKRQEACWCMVVCTGDLNVDWGKGGARAGLFYR